MDYYIFHDVYGKEVYFNAMWVNEILWIEEDEVGEIPCTKLVFNENLSFFLKETPKEIIDAINSSEEESE